jgi:hypothetical protein
MNKLIVSHISAIYRAELRFGKWAAGVVRAARGGKDGGSPMFEKRAGVTPSPQVKGLTDMVNSI